MRPVHSRFSLAAVTVALTLALTQLVVALVAADVPPYARLIVLVSCLLMSLAGLAVFRRNCLPSRVTASATAVLSAGGAVLVGTAGLPGGAPAGLSGTGSGVIALGLAVAVLLLLDAHTSPATATKAPPYAL